jgi:hypothetical protein
MSIRCSRRKPLKSCCDISIPCFLSISLYKPLFAAAPPFHLHYHHRGLALSRFPLHPTRLRQRATTCPHRPRHGYLLIRRQPRPSQRETYATPTTYLTALPTSRCTLQITLLQTHPDPSRHPPHLPRARPAQPIVPSECLRNAPIPGSPPFALPRPP